MSSSGSVLPKALMPGSLGTAQAWSPLKADKTHHALAFFFFFLSVLFCFIFLVRVSIFAFEIYFPNLKYYIHTPEMT